MSDELETADDIRLLDEQIEMAERDENYRPPGNRCHLIVETGAGDNRRVVIDQDVNGVEVGIFGVRWFIWEEGRRSNYDSHSVSLSTLSRIEITVPRDRLARPDRPLGS